MPLIITNRPGTEVELGGKLHLLPPLTIAALRRRSDSLRGLTEGVGAATAQALNRYS